MASRRPSRLARSFDGGRTRSAGVTLIELMIVVAIGVLLLFVVVPGFNDFILQQRLRNTAGQVVTDLQYAKAEAAARNELGRIRFNSDANVTCYVIYTAIDNSKICDCRNGAGSACAEAGTSELRTFSLPRSTRIAMGTPGGSPTPPSAFAFHHVTGGLFSIPTDLGSSPIPLAGIVVAQVSSSRRISVLVNQAGRVTRCLPTGSSATGEVAC